MTGTHETAVGRLLMAVAWESRSGVVQLVGQRFLVPSTEVRTLPPELMILPSDDASRPDCATEHEFCSDRGTS